MDAEHALQKLLKWICGSLNFFACQMTPPSSNPCSIQTREAPRNLVSTLQHLSRRRLDVAAARGRQTALAEIFGGNTDAFW